MKVLIIYTLYGSNNRKTINDSLYCFKRYIKNVNFFYLNVHNNIPGWLSSYKFDGVIFHYSFLAQRYSVRRWNIFFKKNIDKIKNISGFKVAIPQDEYNHTNDLRMFFKDAGISTVFTCAYPIDYEVLYPKEETGLRNYFTTYTGFVDEDSLITINNLKKEVPHRLIDVGYRARSLPFWLGRHGQLKTKIAKEFLKFKDSSGLRMDVAITNDNNNAYLGLDWYRFLLRCRTMLGSLGGTGLLDEDGSIREKVDNYIRLNPNACFDEVEEKCFPGLDGELHMYALSPRHFECAMTKTCQVLVEGDYNGVFLPDLHFIEVKKDFSNIKDVLEKIKDKEYCEKIAEQCYKDIVESGKYTYKLFSEKIINHIRDNSINCDLNNKYKNVDNYFKLRLKLASYFEFIRGFLYLSAIKIIKTILPASGIDILKKIRNKY